MGGCGVGVPLSESKGRDWRLALCSALFLQGPVWCLAYGEVWSLAVSLPLCALARPPSAPGSWKSSPSALPFAKVQTDPDPLHTATAGSWPASGFPPDNPRNWTSFPHGCAPNVPHVRAPPSSGLSPPALSTLSPLEHWLAWGLSLLGLASRPKANSLWQKVSEAGKLAKFQMNEIYSKYICDN